MLLLSIMFIVSYFQNRQGLFVNYSSGAKYTLPSNSRIFFKRKVVGWFPIQFLTSQGLTYVAVFSRDSQGFPVRHVFLVVGLYSKTVFIWSFKTMTLNRLAKSQLIQSYNKFPIISKLNICGTQPTLIMNSIFRFVSAVNRFQTRESVSDLVKFCLFPSYYNIYHFTITSHSFRFVLTGYKRTLSDADLWDLGDSFQASNVVTRAKGSWKQEQTKCFKYESHFFGMLSKQFK